MLLNDDDEKQKLINTKIYEFAPIHVSILLLLLSVEKAAKSFMAILEISDIMIFIFSVVSFFIVYEFLLNVLVFKVTKNND